MKSNFSSDYSRTRISVIEAVDMNIRNADERDLLALEWDGEYTRFRRLYQEAMQEARKGKRAILVAEVGDLIVGQLFVNFHSTWRKSYFGQRTGYLHSFRVKPDFRNQGVGRTLIAQGERILKQRGFNKAVISVAQTNEAALRLYKSLGFEVIREDPGRWSFMDHHNQIHHVIEPAYILRKSL